MSQAELELRSRKAARTTEKDAAKSSRLLGAAGTPSDGRAAGSHVAPHGRGLAFMVLDVTEEGGGRFHVWGCTASGASVLVRVDDFVPYLYVAAPERVGGGGGALSEADLEKLWAAWNRALPAAMRIRSLEPVTRRPIMFYRPAQPQGGAYLKVSFPPGSSMKKAGKVLGESKPQVAGAGLRWPHANMHEHEVGLLQRFLVDTGLSSGCWLHLPPARPAAPGWHAVPEKGRASSCALEAAAGWEALQPLTPDATQMTGWQPREVDCTEWRAARAAAAEGAIAPLKLLILDAQLAPADGRKRVPVAGADPIVAITCIIDSLANLMAESGGGGGLPAAEAGEGADDGDGMEGAALPPPPPAAAAAAAGCKARKVVLLWQAGCSEGWQLADPGPGAEVRCFASEAAMLRAWQQLFAECDPDAIATFQVRDTLGALAERWRALRLDGGNLMLSRGAPGQQAPLRVKSVVQYTPNWVKNQQRMASTSNQETFRADIEGRLVFDVLRHVLTAASLASFSRADCCALLLGRPLEQLPADVLAALAGLGPAAAEGPHPAAAGSAQQRALRLARYACGHCAAVRGLLARLASVPETLEIARAVGLTAGQALYNAQMVRTHSLLLRAARRAGYIIGGRQEVVQLQESPFLLHPIEAKTAGLYAEPVAVLDFASLYPSLFRAHNLSYDTLLTREDAAAMPPDALFRAPTGECFVSAAVRPGVLPGILKALVEARAATRALLAGCAGDPARAAVLDSRQKALKMTANALYGFTGAQASPLQCTQLADACLALGAQACRTARQHLGRLCAGRGLGAGSAGGRVVYGQTDSLFCHFPAADRAQAVRLAQAAAAAVSAAFPAPVELKFERVCQPFLLLHVNRYAGRAFESEAAARAGEGQLLVKGLKSMWRQAAPLLRGTLQGVLHRLLMQEDAPAAVAFAERAIRRLLEGRCELSEAVMTGGLWRVTGQQLEKAAKGGDGGEDVRGPHATLAVKLQQRDPGRTFVLGERLQYVLLPGQRLQDEAAEDPLTAALAGRSADWELYWRAKLQRPLREVFAAFLSPAALQELMDGPHTKVRVEQAAVAERPPAGKQKGPQQAGLARFYRASVRCLGCKRAIPPAELPQQAGAPQPGLCADCAALPGKRAGALLEWQAEASAAAGRAAGAAAACARCHSGGLAGAVACENGECGVLYARLGAAARLDAASAALQRLDW